MTKKVRAGIRVTASFIAVGFFVIGLAQTQSEQQAENRIIINADQARHRISKYIYGHFSEHLGRCIYEGYWVGEDSSIKNMRGIRQDVVDALKKIRIPVLRWPGGCFADEYHWKDTHSLRHDRTQLLRGSGESRARCI